MTPRRLRLPYPNAIIATLRAPITRDERGVLSIETLRGPADYWVELLPVGEGFRLTARGLVEGASYDVTVSPLGEHCCTCPDFEKRSGWDGRACKHIHAVYAVGLLTKFPPPGIMRASEEPSEEIPF